MYLAICVYVNRYTHMYITAIDEKIEAMNLKKNEVGLKGTKGRGK